MKSACDCIKKLWSCPVAVCSGIVLISVLALSTAFTAQFALKLEPCIMCLYQRIPFAITIVLGISGLLLRKNARAAATLVALSALAFAVNTVFGFYHVGIEERWWVSFVEGCQVPQFASTEGMSVLDQLLKTPAVSCDQVAWRDPVLKLSMAGWNAVLCAFLALSCAVAAWKIKAR